MEIRRRRISKIILVLAVVSICYGVYRGEADTVFAKAINLCLECIGIG